MFSILSRCSVRHFATTTQTTGKAVPAVKKVVGKKASKHPKRAPTAYNLFIKQHMSTDKAPMAKRMVIGAEKWSNMSDADREIYEVSARTAKIMYDNNKPPKRPANGYAKFVRDNYSQYAHVEFSERAALLAEKWKKVSVADKEAAKVQYKKEMDEYSAEYAKWMIKNGYTSKK